MRFVQLEEALVAFQLLVGHVLNPSIFDASSVRFQELLAVLVFEIEDDSALLVAIECALHHLHLLRFGRIKRQLGIWNETIVRRRIHVLIHENATRAGHVHTVRAITLVLVQENVVEFSVSCWDLDELSCVIELLGSAEGTVATLLILMYQFVNHYLELSSDEGGSLAIRTHSELQDLIAVRKWTARLLNSKHLWRFSWVHVLLDEGAASKCVATGLTRIL